MSHSLNNKDCLRNYLPSDFNILLHDLPDCTCPPAVNEVVTIREEECCIQPKCRAYRAALLRIVDQQTESLEIWKTIAREQDYKLDRAAKRVGAVFGSDAPDEFADEIIKLRTELAAANDRYLALWRKTKPIADPCSGECHISGRCPHNPVCND